MLIFLIIFLKHDFIIKKKLHQSRGITFNLQSIGFCKVTREKYMTLEIVSKYIRISPFVPKEICSNLKMLWSIKSIAWQCWKDKMSSLKRATNG